MDAPGLGDEPTDFDDEDIPSSDSDLIWLGGELCMDMQGRLTDLDGKVSSSDKQSLHDRLVRWSANPAECAVYLAAFDEAIERVPYLAFLYLHRGVAHEARREYALAMVDFNKAIELEPANARAYFERHILNAKLGKYDKAAEDLYAAIRLGFADPP
jgi:tetratricopeptide (TPR) repeat protein